MSDEWLDDRKKAELAELLEGRLPPDARLLVRATREGVRLSAGPEAARAKLSEEHEDLYGSLLAVNESLSGSGCLVIFLLPALAATACVGVHLGWFASLFGADLSALKSYWFYGLFVGIALAAGFWVSSLCEKAVYLSRRGEILEGLDRAGITPTALLARIADDSKLTYVSNHLKTDRHVRRELR